MPVPDFQTLMRPVLALVQDGESYPNRRVIDLLANQFRLDPVDRDEMIASGQKRRFDSNVSWAITYLFQAGLLERPARAHIRITSEGRSALSAHTDRIDMKVLSGYPKYREFIARTGTRKKAGSGVIVSIAAGRDQGSSPQELLDAAEAENRAAVVGELLERARAIQPREFELLVIRLLDRMGYGRRGHIEHSGQPGDRGIDGIISQDPLGLDRIYIQAKRYTENVVQRPEIQKFVGALMGAQGDRGVFITTSTFSSGAKTEAERVNARIELIDGKRLAELMLEHGVGTQSDVTVTLFRIDEDFFETL